MERSDIKRQSYFLENIGENIHRLPQALKYSINYLGAAGGIAALATTCFDKFGKNFVDLSSYIGKNQLIDGSSFLTGFLAYGAYEAGANFSAAFVGEIKYEKRTFSIINVFAGIGTSILFAYVASIPYVTALAFVILGLITKKLCDEFKIYKEVSEISSFATPGALVYETGARAVTWLTGTNGLSIGYRAANTANLINFGILAVAILASNCICNFIGYQESRASAVRNAVVITGFIITNLYVSPVSLAVNGIMLASSIGLLIMV